MKGCCTPKTFEKLTSLFKALGDSKRMAMFRYLCVCHEKGANSTNVSELSSCCDLDLSVVSRHLSKLKDAGVFKARKEGKEVHYELNKKELANSLRALADYVDSL